MIPVFFGHCRSTDKKVQALSAPSGRRCSSPPGVPGSLCNAQPQAVLAALQDKGWGLAGGLSPSEPLPCTPCSALGMDANCFSIMHLGFMENTPPLLLFPPSFSWRVSWEGNGDGKQSGFVCWFNASQIAVD